ncbi:MAG: hypothetical protein D6786_08880 [Gammaproteobacteria bacterium]|nr:MAG: hypothetical protein D6786_08880 [Gammaproteobacteria bacterium]
MGGSVPRCQVSRRPDERSDATMNAKMNRWLVALLMVLVAPVSLAAVEAGRIVYAYGEAHAIDAGGASRGLAKDDVVLPGDTLKTGKGRLQVRFADGGFISLQPDSEFRVEEFRFSGKEDGTESAFFRLVKGGLRAITGLIGHRHKETYKLKTALATIGIRGTAFRVRLCQGDCFRPDGSPLPDGLYTKTGEGVIFVRNDAGVLDLPAGMASFVRDRSTPPKPARDLPPMAKRHLRGGKPLKRARRETGRAGKMVRSGFQAGEQLTSGGGNQALGGGSPTLLYGFAVSPSNVLPTFRQADGHADTVVDGVPPEFAITFNPQTSSYVGHAIGTARNRDTRVLDGMFLTRWTEGTTFDTNGGSTVLGSKDGLHLIAGTYPAMPTAATATYVFAGGTKSTNGVSVDNGATSGSISVDFNSQVISAFTMDVKHGTTYTVSGSGPIQVVTAPSGNRGLIFGSMVQGSSYSVTPTASVDLAGAFYGSSGSGGNVAPSSAGVVYQILDGGTVVQGAAGFKRN